jgi:hypothetical protein
VETPGGGFSFDHSVKSYLVGHEAHVAGTIDPETPEPDQRRAVARLLVQVQGVALEAFPDHPASYRE